MLKKWTVANGLLSNNINRIKADGDFMWIAGDKGIQQLCLKTSTFKNLTRQDGILTYSISDIEILGDKIYFAGSENVFSIDRKLAFKKFQPLEVYFTEVLVNDKKVPLASSYSISQEESLFEIAFNSNGLRAMTSGRYEYRLQGLSEVWKTVAYGNNRISFSSIPQGDYVMQLRTVTDTGETVSLKEIALEVTVPFYKTLWFWILVMSLLTIAIVFYYKRKLRFRESEKQKALEQIQQDRKLTQLKLENLRSQMNPHFVFNALNSIQDYIVRNHKTLASDYLGKFADLIRTYLEHSTVSKITLAEEIETLEMYLELEKLRFEDKLDYQIIIEPDLDTRQVLIPTMLIQPYAENAIKHGLLHRKKDRLLTISLRADQDQKILYCLVKDNGVGRRRAQEINDRNHHKKKSFATSATENRLQLLNYGNSKKIGVEIIDLIENNQAVGTEIRINIPFETNL